MARIQRDESGGRRGCRKPKAESHGEQRGAGSGSADGRGTAAREAERQAGRGKAGGAARRGRRASVVVEEKGIASAAITVNDIGRQRQTDASHRNPSVPQRESARILRWVSVGGQLGSNAMYFTSVSRTKPKLRGIGDGVTVKKNGKKGDDVLKFRKQEVAKTNHVRLQKPCPVVIRRLVRRVGVHLAQYASRRSRRRFGVRQQEPKMLSFKTAWTSEGVGEPKRRGIG
ncbi:hypothetical protein B0H13DRAFT_1905877 [Mycena leptocephala]|nr:hypothetical protein B0H13DRAFT_1905877 [Mycena leptocephala]